MFCFFSPSKCVELLQICGEQPLKVLLDYKAATKDEVVSESAIDREVKHKEVTNDEALVSQGIDNDAINVESKVKFAINEVSTNEDKLAIDKESTNEDELTIDKVSTNEDELTIDKVSTNEDELTIDKVSTNEDELTIDKVSTNEDELTIDKVSTNEDELTIDKATRKEARNEFTFDIVTAEETIQHFAKEALQRLLFDDEVATDGEVKHKEATSEKSTYELAIAKGAVNESTNKEASNREVLVREGIEASIEEKFDKICLEQGKEKKMVLESVPTVTPNVPAVLTKMHSSECNPAVPATGPNLLLQLGKLIIRARSRSPAASKSPASTAPRASKLAPSTSSQVIVSPAVDSSDGGEESVLEEELASRVSALWSHMEPVCIEVSLCAECRECAAPPVYERARRALLLERWTMRAIPYNKSKDPPALINSQWLLNAVRSQLHFSQLSAWLARLHQPPQPRRKLSREQNYKKMEANCDGELERKLSIVYSITAPGKTTEFAKPPTDHTFPCTDIGNNTYLKVNLESLPRLDDIPPLKCPCQSQCQSQKRRPSKDHTDELVGKLNDLSIGSRKYDGAINSNIGTPTRRLSIISNPGSTEYLFTAVDKELVDDRMHTPCSENGKHKCNCDDESDGNKDKEKQPPKKLDERRLKEIAKYKRRIRKEKMKKLCDSTSSEGEIKSKETTSIPILQASRFDRFRAIGCYRNQTYLTLPASRIETKSPFIEPEYSPPDFKKTNTVGTQTDDICQCGNKIDFKCDSCHKCMVRSDGSYNLASLSDDRLEIGGRRKLDNDDDEKSLKKHKCDNSIKCDNVNINIDGLIKRPKLRRVLPIVDRLERIVSDRMRDTENGQHCLKRDKHFQDYKVRKDQDIQDLHLNTDDSVFSVPKDSKRQKTFSLSDDGYVLYEKCDYGTIDRSDAESPKEERPDFKFTVPQTEDCQNGFEKENIESLKEGFVFPDPKKGHDDVPSPSEMERFRWRFDSAASMVFHTKTGLPLTSSPAPLRRGNNCFDFDDSINGISGIKSALFHPIPSPSPADVPPSPPAPRPARRERNKLHMGPSAGLLGSFEESALQGRLEAVATVHGFTAELGASGAFCPPHVRLPVTVFFYAPGGTNAPYMGHINLGPQGYRVARSGTIQVSLFNPHGTLVKMFVVLYELGSMPSGARTFLRQRTLYMPPGAEPAPADRHKYMRYLIHLRFMTSKSGKLYLHTDIRLIVSRKADLDTATAHSALFRPIPTKNEQNNDQSEDKGSKPTNRAPNRVFGGSSEYDSERHAIRELGYENQDGVSYELRSFTYAPENPKYSPR